MRDMEQMVECAATAVGVDQMTQEAYDATVVARDDVRALAAGRVAPPPDADQGRYGLEAYQDRAPEDARLTIRGNEIVIDVNIHLYGSGASQRVANAFERQIQRDWGQNPATRQP